MTKTALILLPIPADGHLTSMVEAALRLLRRHNHRFSVTVLVPSLPIAPAQTAFIHSVISSDLDINFQHLPSPPPPAESDADNESVAFISNFLLRLQPYIKASISGILATSPAAALVIDFFASSAIDAATELGVPTYLYMTSSASALALMLHLPEFNKNHSPTAVEDRLLPVELPGMEPIPPLCLPTSVTNTKSSSFSWLRYHGRKLIETKGIIVNTFAALEPSVLKALAEGLYVADRPTPPVYPIGPILRKSTNVSKEQHETLKWLDGQPPASVVFLCFGSMGSFEASQIKEIAVGLESSGHRFLWALRGRPIPGLPVPILSDGKLEEVLPEGLLERTRERALVWPTAVPQAEILAHVAVGGFVTHCGWNSILESLWCGVPTMTWPLYAEQHLNAFRMARDQGLAVELRVEREGGGGGTGGMVTAEEVEEGVKRLMGQSKETKMVRERCGEIMRESRKAVEEGGSSFLALERLAEDLANA